eukprot:TRINITY_DN1171_c2_g1_i2.p1 TRINITY_DN1171_c2_g1~~TRINITY_DN1171_c2_g1_i2.p1  ORF type:complete len:102 (+),score=12.84 TRINITY_DN1171_c2_g1_i2:251-556(+)
MERELSELFGYRYGKGFFSDLHKLEKRKCYKEKTMKDMNILVSGSGPSGLCFAIEAKLLGADPVVIEKRNNFTRNNCLHLWKSSLVHLTKLLVKKFYKQLL